MGTRRLSAVVVCLLIGDLVVITVVLRMRGAGASDYRLDWTVVSVVRIVSGTVMGG